MKITITGRKVNLKDSFKEKVETKLKKFDKLFNEEADANVTVTVEKNCQKVEVTIKNNGMLYRAEQSADEMEDALDSVMDVLARQIRKNKTRLEKQKKANVTSDLGYFDYFDDGNEETEFNLVRSKKFDVTPLFVDDAILYMNQIGHEFYMFLNMDTDEINVVYKRNNGDYGLLEPQR